MRLRIFESVIASRFVFWRKLGGPATFDFCNTIGTKLPIQHVRSDVSFWGEAELLQSDPIRH
jgi:hypothetical protein